MRVLKLRTAALILIGPGGLALVQLSIAVETVLEAERLPLSPWSIIVAHNEKHGKHLVEATKEYVCNVRMGSFLADMSS